MSTDKIRNGYVWDGFDYRLQVWVKDGIIQTCNHPEAMKRTGCCNQHQLGGQSIMDVPGAEIRENPRERQ
ncbi:MAG: hypothetical protein ACE5FZ_10220 [Nitrospiria bacterium]